MGNQNKWLYTVLVSGASGIVGYGILRSLRATGCRLIGATIYHTSPADCFADLVVHPPLSNTPEYIPWLINTIKCYNIDMIIPAIEADMEVWNIHREILEKTGTKVLLNDSELITICLDKWKFYNKLREAHFNHCIETSITHDFQHFTKPFIIKPMRGYGSKGVVQIETKEEFEQYESEIGKSLIMQEYVGNADEEYTASAFFDRISSLKAYIVMRRKLSKAGYTESSEVVFIDELIDIIRELSNLFKPIGPTNFQFRRHKGQWKLLEINPRISSSTSIRTAFNYNESTMSIDYFLKNKEISQPKIKTGKAIRYIEDYVVYDSNIV